MPMTVFAGRLRIDVEQHEMDAPLPDDKIPTPAAPGHRSAGDRDMISIL